MSPDLLAFAALILAYLLGSVSAAIIVCRLMGLPDPRTDGSGNPGTTNVLRLGGKPAALLTLTGDMLKGVIPVLIGRELGMDDMLLSAIGFAAFLGHLYPIFFRFEGGKGVATALGVLLALHWQVGMFVIVLWIAGFALTRISSVGAITAFVAAPFLANWLMPEAMLGVVGMSLLLLARHKENIKALIEGRERKFGGK
ncbi:glycerol-3-phosphate 1-O-acyltransferase PlsY [Perlucidibaca piscinae]|uniref:glycerol-3-phosphate 1-O-acyltransferase PlsY n=1 Tax=Perlucidibaca piscinae TaxID=392589 RepID=UPI0003B46561|nr:glycerol-3-phosphate 1-O-acyltransferase PlsY [Perlucidibaca piscinae]